MAEALRRAPGAGRPPVAERAPAVPILAARGLSVAARGRTILRDVGFEVAPGEAVAVLGPSGVGKSTLLKCLNRLVDLEEGLTVTGEVTFRGRPIYARGVDPDALRAEIGILFQRPAVFPGSIRKNALFALRHLATGPRREWEARAVAALEEVGLWREVRSRLDEPACELSAGQQQRLCLARALAVEPRVLLMDEPTSALDPEATSAIEALVLKLKRRRAIVLVTHLPAQAERVADRCLHLALLDGAGEIVAAGAPGRPQGGERPGGDR